MGMLDARVAIVTGSSSGIGRGCALRFAEEGAAVVACARRMDKLEELVDEIKSNGGEALAVQCDVAIEADITKVVDTAAERYGRIDILANIAQGFMGSRSNVMETTRESLIDLFVTGPVQTLLFMQKCFPLMKAQGYGRIINTSSHATTLGAPDVVPYGMVKAAITALSKSAAKDWGQYGIVTNTIYPSSPSEQYAAAHPELAEQFPVGRFGTAYGDISPVVAFLASEGAGYVNGQSVSIDAGFTLHVW